MSRSGGPGGIFVIDNETFELRPGQWEKERGPQFLSYDFAWHLGHDTIVTSEWGTPEMVGEGVNPELLLAGEYGNSLHVWNMRKRKHIRAAAVRRVRSVQPEAHRIGADRRIVERAAHPSRPGRPLNGGPQMVEVSRDGRRVYVTNSLYSPWDAQSGPRRRSERCSRWRR